MKKPQIWLLAGVAVAGVFLLSRSGFMKQPQKNKFTTAAALPLIKPFKIIIRYLGVFGNQQNPYRQGYGYHTGLDYIGLDKNRGFNNPVVSVADGVVVQSTPTASPKGYGELVVIEHPQFKIWTRYAHLNTRTVKVGAVVKAGQQIGTLGTSGTDNTHLHFDIARKPALRADWRGFPSGGFTESQVRDIFIDPLLWFKENKAVNLGDL
jgi:murein DD-endopeptidase MepM/ murein hydrolase activator NlpD